MDRREAIRRTSLLMGGALSASAITAVMSGCQAAPTEPGWTPMYLKPEEGQMVAEIAERIIPATDTPGAKDAGVHRFIDLFLQDNATREEQILFQSGLADLNARANDKHGKNFVKLTSEQMDDILGDISAGSEASQEDMAANIANEGEAVQGGAFNPRKFFDGICQLTILGFFTSELGATQVLKMDEIPTEYLGCIPYSEVGGTWAL